MIKSGRMRWTGHTTGMGAKWNACRALVRKSEGKRPLGDLDIDGRIILKLILEKWVCSMDSIPLVDDRGKWRVPINWVMNSWVT
jgi:hypothetical protein